VKCCVGLRREGEGALPKLLRVGLRAT